MRRPYLYIIMSSLLLAACSSDDHEPTADSPVAVAFSATMASPDTRAANAINDNSDLQGYGFGVFACYTGLHGYSDSNVHPDFMYNEHVQYDAITSHQWIYSPLKYWPNGEGEVEGNTGKDKHYVSFMAYAPYSDANENEPETNPQGYCIPSFSLQGEMGNPWLTYRLHENVAKQVDLLYAPALLDQTKPAVDARLTFQFAHALSCVGDKITITCSEGIKNQAASRVTSSITDAKVVITGFTIKYTLTSKARLVLWNNGEAYWQTIFSEEPTCTRIVNVADADLDVYTNSDATHDPYVIEGKGVYYIPKEFAGYPQTAEVNISYCVATYSGGTWNYDNENTGTATLTLKNYPDAYQTGKHLYLNITLNQMNIGFTAAIAPWNTVDPVDVEGIEE